MSKPDSDYLPHVICINGMLMGIWMTKHGAIEVAEAMYKNRSYEIHRATAGHYQLMRSSTL